jgi:uncharacterized membrane protein
MPEPDKPRATAASQGDAQRRADQIRAFQNELEQLEREGVLILSIDQQREVAQHHRNRLDELQSRFDIDTTAAEKQMSWGMRIASFIGALAFSAAAFFFFYRFWGNLSTTLQVVILVAGPIAAVLAMVWSAGRERTLYIAGIIGFVAIACFVLNISVLGQIFNLRPTQNAFLVWALFAGILAYTYGIRLFLVAGILSFMGYLSATVGTWSGCYWMSFGERPENFIPAGIFLFCLPAVLTHRRFPGFTGIYRIFGLLPVFIAILILSNFGAISYLLLPNETVEVFYQIAGFVLAGLAIWAGIYWSWSGVTNLGSTFFVIFLYTKLFDWWWDWMPKYLFFLVLGAIAVLLLVVLRKLRTRSMRGTT